MAALEPDRLVVRVVYAGAPMAGKTATVRALMPLLKGPGAERFVKSPAEHRGRTAFFDWADYEGGAFEGRPIHCQIATAPGQVALSDRRELVIRGADAVILVVDSRSDAIERTLQCYEEMAPWLAEAGRDAPIRILLQCNKQDLAGSLTPAQLSRALGLDFGRDVYPTSARTTKGLRAAFVAGVRAAVERAKLLLERGLIANAPEIGSGEELLARMQLPVRRVQPDAVSSRVPRRAEPKPAAVSTRVAKPSPPRRAEPLPRRRREGSEPRASSERLTPQTAPRRGRSESTRSRAASPDSVQRTQRETPAEPTPTPTPPAAEAVHEVATPEPPPAQR